MVTAKSVMRDHLRRHTGKLVRIDRFVDGAEQLLGVVVDVGRKWVLIARDRDYAADGFVCLRIADIERVKFEPSRHRVAQAAWESQGHWAALSLQRELSLVRTGLLLDSITEVFCLYIEYQDPDVVFVGSLGLHQGTDLVLNEITPDGIWAGASRWSHNEISRVEFSDSYSRALSVAAGPRVD